MNKSRRTTANLPPDLLDQAMRASGLGITDTIIEGLKLVRRTRAFSLASKLRGKVKFDIDLDSSRERNRN